MLSDDFISKWYKKSLKSSKYMTSGDGDCTNETQVYVQCPFSPAMSPPELSCPAIFARMKRMFDNIS